jgi:hypothetical protein
MHGDSHFGIVLYCVHMDQPRSYSRYILVALCIAVVFTALILVALNAWMKQPGSSFGFKDRYQDGYVQGCKDTRERLLTAGLLRRDPDPKALVGIVVSVGKDSLVVKQTNLDTNPIVDNVPDERNVLVASSTKIIRRVWKSREVYEKEQQEFIASGAPPEKMPVPITEDTISHADIKAGDHVAVTTVEDIRLLETVNATQVILVIQ